MWLVRASSMVIFYGIYFRFHTPLTNGFHTSSHTYASTPFASMIKKLSNVYSNGWRKKTIFNFMLPYLKKANSTKLVKLNFTTLMYLLIYYISLLSTSIDLNVRVFVYTLPKAEPLSNATTKNGLWPFQMWVYCVHEHTTIFFIKNSVWTTFCLYHSNTTYFND